MKAKTKEEIAKIFLSNGKGFRKNLIKWDVPYDLIRQSNKLSERIIGFGKWKNNNKKFIVLVDGSDVFYIEDKKIAKEIWEYMKIEKRL